MKQTETFAYIYPFTDIILNSDNISLILFTNFKMKNKSLRYSITCLFSDLIKLSPSSPKNADKFMGNDIFCTANCLNLNVVEKHFRSQKRQINRNIGINFARL